MKIAVDYDDVLVPFLESFLSWYNQANGTNHDPMNNREYSLVPTFGNSRQYWADHMNEFHRSGLSAQMTPYENSIETLEKLSKNHEIVILTSRPSMHRSHLEDWISQHAGDIVQELHMFEGKDQHKPTIGHDKGSACLGLGAGLLIDDNHGYVQSAVDSGVGGILFGHHRWTEAHRDTYDHAHNWQEVYDIVEQKYQ